MATGEWRDWRAILPAHRLSSALDSGRCTVHEGVVVDLVPGDLTKPREESFRLASAAGDFVYHSNLGNADPGYSPFTTPGVVITNGMRLRLCEDGGRVGRIEVAE